MPLNITRGIEIFIKSIIFDRKEGWSSTIVIFTFDSDRSYRCYYSGDELLSFAMFEVPLQTDNGSLSVCNPFIKEEVKWCEDHYDELVNLYEEK